MSNLTYSNAAVQLVKRFEGLRLQAYDDGGGVSTIGWGHTGADVFHGLTITETQAEKLLEHDLYKASVTVNALVTVDLTQSQFDALVDFVFNVGPTNFKQSTLLRMLNSGNFAKASEEFGKWIYQHNKVLPGLVARRQAETELFNCAS